MINGRTRSQHGPKVMSDPVLTVKLRLTTFGMTA